MPARARRAAAIALAITALSAASASAQTKLQAHYSVKMTGVTIGEAEWQAEIGPDAYSASASGSASGMLSVLVKGKGTAAVRGAVKNGVLAPASFTSRLVEDKETDELRMTIEDGVATEVVAQGEAPKGERVPLTDQHRRGIVDPLTALMLTPAGAADVLAPENCNRTLPIFDGRRRYNLALSYKRIETVKADKGYAGPVLVCGVVLEPIAGHRPDSMLIKYVAGRRDAELWLAPIGAARVAAPFRLAMPTLVGTMELRATAFETTTAPKP
jgi:hypothetical protein